MKTIFALVMLTGVAAFAGSLDHAYNATVRAVDLYASYRSNEVSADAKYQNQRLSVGGIIEKVAKDSDGDPFILLQGRVRCRFSEAFNGKIARLQPGTAIGISGTVVGLKGGVVVLKDCSF
ncbi:MAG: tRNA anti-like [Verrucomicrobiota bacterium]